VADGESDIGGSNGRHLQVRAPRGTKTAKPRRNGFTAKRKEAFLSHFAATCNAKASARAAGVAHTTVYQHRKSDPAFRAAWEEALDQGYARLEAELVRRASVTPKVHADEKAARSIASMDPKVALAILESYRRNRGAKPGDILPRASDAEQVRTRLEKKMRALRIVDSEGRLIAPAEPEGEDEK
jgi:hypothetical protein